MDEAYGPMAANETVGCGPRTARGSLRNASRMRPIPRVSTLAGSNTGIEERISGSQCSGTGRLLQCVGSLRSPLWQGTTNFVEGPNASIKASTTTSGPPATQPSADIEECTKIAAPCGMQSLRKSATRMSNVTGPPRTASARAIAAASPDVDGVEQSYANDLFASL